MTITAPISIINARLIGKNDFQEILINHEGIIESIASMNSSVNLSHPGLQVIDVQGDWVSLGGVDLQINGALGLAFPDVTLEDREKIEEICHFLWQQGVDAFLPTIVTTSIEKIKRSLSTFSALITSIPKKGTAQIIGVHLEGPFLNPQKRGAHPEEHILSLTLDNVKRVLGNYSHLIKIITLAPELEPTGEVISYLHSLGITVSLGHSQATASQAQQAFKQGASMVTHAFNAMPSLHHREPGLLGAAIINPKVKCGLIADGQHVSPIMIKLLLQAANYQQGIFLVSDALSPLGLPDGIYPWDTRTIEVKDGTARLSDGTLSGTTLPLLVGLQNLINWKICDLETAISLVTDSPRLAINLPLLAPRQPANLLRWTLEKTTNILTWRRLF